MKAKFRPNALSSAKTQKGREAQIQVSTPEFGFKTIKLKEINENV